MLKRCWGIRLGCLAVLIISSLSASALIMVGRGNAPVKDNHWPAGSLEVANLKCRVGFWEGPPFGGGEYCFQYRGDTKTFNDALDKFAQIKAPELLVVVHEGPTSSDFLKDEKDAKADTSVDWTFTVWNPVSWHHLYNSNSVFAADQPEFRGDVDPPRLDVYVSEGRIDWSRVQVPAGVKVTDERATANGYAVGDGAVIRGEAYDMSTSKPINAIEVIVEKSKPRQPDGLYEVKGKKAAEDAAAQYPWDKVASSVGDVDGRFEVKQIPAGNYRVIVRCVGYAPRSLGYISLTKNTLKTYKTQLSPEAQVSGIVTDPEGKPIAGVKLHTSGVTAFNGRGYPCADEPQVITDAEGRFTFSGMPRGHTQLWAHADHLHQVEVLKSYDSPSDNIKITMAATGTVHGKVVDRAGKPAANGNVSIWPEGGSKPGTWGGGSNLKEDGAFAFENVPPGKYFISANAADQFDKNSKATLIEVKAGETVSVELTQK